MSLGKFILSVLLFVDPLHLISQNWKLIDSIAQKSSLVAIDPLNNIYGIESQLGYFFRIDQNKKITKQYIKRFANQISYIIKNDPLKIAYVIPSESKVVSIDPNFQKLSTYNDPYSDPLFSFCLYRDGSQCYFINYSLKLLSASNQVLATSEQIRFEGNHESLKSILLSDGQLIYLWIEKIGIFSFDQNLNLKAELKMPTIQHVDVFEQKVYFLMDDCIFEWNGMNSESALIFISDHKLSSFSINNKYLILADAFQIKYFTKMD